MELRDLIGVRAPEGLPEEELARLPPRELAERLRALRSVTEAALTHLAPTPLLEQVLERVRAALAVDTVTVLLRSDDGRMLEVRASLGPAEAAPRVAIPVGQGIVGAVAHQGRAVIADDAAQLHGTDSLPPTPGSLMAVPLPGEGEALGVLHVGSLRPRRFTDAELALLRAMGDQLALALLRSRLHQAAVREAQQEHAVAEGVAAEANRAKSDFLAVMSHELRTPLAAVMGYAELLRLGIPVAIPPEAVVQVERIEHSARHLLRLIEEILSFSRAVAGRERVYRSATDVRDAVLLAVEPARPMAAGKGLAMRVEVPESSVLAHTDPHKVREIVAHLLVNAVQFTQAGEVGVRLEEEGDAVVIRVHDTGTGIAPEHHARIFEPFWQVNQGSTREVGGMGLGLAIARRLARLLGGDLELETEVGRGSTFTLRLPRE